jgi:peptide/nickel transport system ATP-binding protein/oligopeptide transport system ATP-binding protein
MALLEVDQLRTVFPAVVGEFAAVDGVSFSLDQGEVLGLVGESGSGKSVTAFSLMRLVSPPGDIAGGSIRFDGQELLALDARAMRRIRGRQMSMIFQEPLSSLNPLHSIGRQVMEPLFLHTDLSRAEARKRALAMLDRVCIPDASRRFDDYPHQLSGGLRQRVMIAIALVCEPKLLIADEPTTALDVTIQAQILDLLRELQRDTRMAMLMITHDLGVVAEVADRINVMYAGRIVETAPVATLFKAPAHPYSAGLMRSRPDLTQERKRLVTIPGTVPAPHQMPSGCRFAPRCEFANRDCQAAQPGLRHLAPAHFAACIYPLTQDA